MQFQTTTTYSSHVLPSYRQTAYSQKDPNEDNDHCTVLIKLLDDNSDIVLAHNTWSNYYTMLRIFKRY